MEKLEERLLLAQPASGPISQDTTWSGTIHITGDVTVNAGVKLTIEPGTSVKFNQGRYLDVDGTIDAQGTAALPIIFTSVQDDSTGEDLSGVGAGVPRRGDWESIYLDPNSPGAIFTNVEIRHAGNTANPGNGGGFLPAIQVRNKTDVSLTDVLVTESDSTAVSIESNSPALTRVSVVGAGGPAFSAAIGATPTLSQLSAAGTATNAYVLGGGTIADDRTWNFGGLPVHLTNNVTVAAGNTLTIVPGQVAKFSQGAFFELDRPHLGLRRPARPFDE